MNRLKTLIVHPKDESTDFLEEIYRDQNFDVLKNPETPKEVLSPLIRQYDRIIMLGHGVGDGLLSGWQLLVDDTHSEALRNKEIVGIWCFANEFMFNNALSGFATGMFISEKEEADLFGICASESEIDHSNRLFAKAVKTNLQLPVSQMKLGVLKTYGSLNNPIVRFNVEQMTYFTGDAKEYER
jgi:hypothetical protein